MHYSLFPSFSSYSFWPVLTCWSTFLILCDLDFIITYLPFAPLPLFLVSAGGNYENGVITVNISLISRYSYQHIYFSRAIQQRTARTTTQCSFWLIRVRVLFDESLVESRLHQYIVKRKQPCWRRLSYALRKPTNSPRRHICMHGLMFCLSVSSWKDILCDD